MSSLKLQTESILQVPFENYDKDFTFIINGKEYFTNKIVADLLSTKISKQHTIDPTFNQINLNTKSNGNFQHILDLINFKSQEVDQQDLNFISEIFEQLQPKNIELTIETTEPTIDNIFEQLSLHQHQKYIYLNVLEKEIDFLSSNLFRLNEESDELFEKLQYDIIERIFTNKNIKLDSEDQLLRIVNRLYRKSSEFSHLYEFVDFVNVSTDLVTEFSSIFDVNDISGGIWSKILMRLNHKIEIEDDEKSNRSKKAKNKVKSKTENHSSKGEEIPFNGNALDGIFNKLKNTSNIGDEVNITKSTEGGGGDLTLFDYDQQDGGPCTNGFKNDWICIEFKRHRVIPTYYSIKTNFSGCHPKSWVIECSNDKVNWVTVDEKINCTDLRGNFVCGSFPISMKEQSEFKFIRLKLTDTNWRNDYYLYIKSFELFGYLI